MSGRAAQQPPQDRVGQVVGDPDAGPLTPVHAGPGIQGRPRRRARTSRTIRATAWIMTRVVTTAASTAGGGFAFR